MTEAEEAERQTLLDHNALCRKVAALEQRSVEQHNTQCRQADVIAALEQQVRDLTAQLAQHEAAPYPHVRYDIRAIGEIVVDGPVLTLDYDIDAQMDTFILDDAQADACELTAEQRARIWQFVMDATNGDGEHAPQR